MPQKATPLLFRFGAREWRVRGLERNGAYDILKVNLRASNEEGFHVDSLDPYQAKQRTAFLKMACTDLGVEEQVLKSDLAQVLRKLEDQQEQVMKLWLPR